MCSVDAARGTSVDTTTAVEDETEVSKRSPRPKGEESDTTRSYTSYYQFDSLVMEGRSRSSRRCGQSGSSLRLLITRAGRLGEYSKVDSMKCLVEGSPVRQAPEAA